MLVQACIKKRGQTTGMGKKLGLPASCLCIPETQCQAKCVTIDDSGKLGMENHPRSCVVCFLSTVASPITSQPFQRWASANRRSARRRFGSSIPRERKEFSRPGRPSDPKDRCVASRFPEFFAAIRSWETKERRLVMERGRLARTPTPSTCRNRTGQFIEMRRQFR